jgi:hypothetical protein
MSIAQDEHRSRSQPMPTSKAVSDPAAVAKAAAAPAATLEPTLCALLQSLRVTGAIRVLPAAALDAALTPAGRPGATNLMAP